MSNLSEKIAVIDIGSNTVRLVVFNGLARAPQYVFNEKVMCGLGEGARQTGRLSSLGVELAKSTLRRFQILVEAMGVQSLRVLATAAVREAEDGPDFVKWAAQELGFHVEVLSGEDEALKSARGVFVGWPDAKGIVCDMGGSSMELAELEAGKVAMRRTSQLGPLRLSGFENGTEQNVFLNAQLEALIDGFPVRSPMLYLVGGSWRAIARVDILRKNYPFPILHEYMLTSRDIAKTIDFMMAEDEASLLEKTGVSPRRMMLAKIAAPVLKALVERLNPQAIAVSSYGLREGALYETMPEEMQKEDPLISASALLESQRARFPGYGDALFEWISPLFTDETNEDRRLRYAACLLHDTNWQSHPDYRAEQSFDVVTMANICGISHQDRIFLGLAIAERYRSQTDTHAGLVTLLSEARQNQARILGRALRLGAMFTGATRDLLESSTVKFVDDSLVLTVNDESKNLAGERVEKRIASLATLIGCDYHIESPQRRFN